MYLGIEFGSTNIKAVTINQAYEVVESSAYQWKSTYDKGIWTYSLDEAWVGLNEVLAGISDCESLDAVGISAMMHGYLPFDKDWNLLVPFRTWQNTITEEAAGKLTKLFDFNIPQRWSVAHLYQAILNKEPHVSQIAHITTLSSYFHYKLTGENVIGIGDASGMFPIDSETNDYDQARIEKFDELLKDNGMPYCLRDILPKVLPAGEKAGCLSEQGSTLVHGKLKQRVAFAPPEGDAGTGMVATNSVKEKTGNVSAGTSIFAMVVLEKALAKLHTEIDMVTTPSGSPVAMVHCNNCTNDLNVWMKLFSELTELFGTKISEKDLYTTLFQKALEGDEDCDGIINYNYMAGEVITGLNEGVPLLFRKPDSVCNVANFMRSQLYGTMATLKLGMDILFEEGVGVDSLLGHGGLFKTAGVCDSFMASALNIPVKCMKTSGEGGPYGMAILAVYMLENKGKALDEFLNNVVFHAADVTVAYPKQTDVDGFYRYMQGYVAGLSAEEAINS